MCLSALVMHYKNWVKIKSNQISILSGFYSVTIPINNIDSLAFVERIPPMERLHGFSALDKEKGLFREFKDSLTNNKVHVFADNILQQKIKIVYNDSLKLYLNLKDSIRTQDLYKKLEMQAKSDMVPN
ncbi:hypothetical protein ACOCEA_03480 [Maribacter sp. CXY002]|uniref:hypothetical protein n=1 Tax=Maribacter luteocoastalis TaxID=3407671 RepID=UPI003B6778DF